MSRSPSRADTLVIPIHGVGYQAEAGIEATVREALREAGHDVAVAEFNWDPGDPESAGVGDTLIRAAHVDVRPREGRGRWLARLHDVVLLAAELLNGLLILLAFVAAPLAVYGESLVGTVRIAEAPSGSSLLLDRWCDLAVGSLLGLAVTLLASLVIGGLRGLEGERPRELASAVRRALLVLLRPLLVLGLFVTRVVAILHAIGSLGGFVFIGALVFGLASLVVIVVALFQGAGLLLTVASVATVVILLRTPVGIRLLMELFYGSRARRLAAGLALLAAVALVGLTACRVLEALSAPSLAVVLMAFVYVAILLPVVLLAPILKVVADCLRYASDDRYRRDVLAHLDRHLAAEAPHGRRVVVAAHSLGSIVAVDSLSSSPAWGARDEVVLVTMGSPLCRLFLRFFPGIRVPTSLEEITWRLRAARPRFRWLNLFRPLDYIGGRFAPEGDAFIEQHATRQQRRFHIGYWDDREVVDALAKILTAPRWSSLETPLPVRDRPERASPLRCVKPLLRWQALLLAPLLALAVLWSTGASFRSSALDLMAWRRDQDQALRDRGRLVEAEVTITGTAHRKDRLMGHQSWRWHYAFSHPVDGEPHERAVAGALAAEAFDPRALRARFAREPYLREERHHPRTRIYVARVAVRYDPDDPARFILPDFPPSLDAPSLVGSLGRTWLQLLFCFLWAAAGVAALATLFLGPSDTTPA